MGFKNGVQKWGPKWGPTWDPKMGSKNGVEKWGPKMGSKMGSKNGGTASVAFTRRIQAVHTVGELPHVSQQGKHNESKSNKFMMHAPMFRLRTRDVWPPFDGTAQRFVMARSCVIAPGVNRVVCRAVQFVPPTRIGDLEILNTVHAGGTASVAFTHRIQAVHTVGELPQVSHACANLQASERDMYGHRLTTLHNILAR